jgi:hypothetical protein
MRVKRYAVPRDARRRSGTVSTVRVDRGLWREALVLASGDASRLRAQRDGTVLVLNQGRQVRPMA